MKCNTFSQNEPRQITAKIMSKFITALETAYFEKVEPTNHDELLIFIEQFTGKSFKQIDKKLVKDYLEEWVFNYSIPRPLIRERKTPFSRLVKRYSTDVKSQLLGAYCSFDNKVSKHYLGIQIQPTDEVKKIVLNHMLTDMDIDYKIIVLDDKCIRFFAQYGKIIGSRLIALIDPETLPEF